MKYAAIFDSAQVDLAAERKSHCRRLRRGRKLAEIEILDAIKRFGGKETLRQVVIEGLVPASEIS